MLHRRAFAPFRAWLPGWLSRPLRRLATAGLTPLVFSLRSGHFQSSLRARAVDRAGRPLPWYTYPCIDFLATRSYENRSVLEFGGGQSTLWWAERARQVITFEGDEEWYRRINAMAPANVELYMVSEATPEMCVAHVEELLSEQPATTFDVIVIDGLYCFEMIPLAIKRVSDRGIIICDNAEGYRVEEGFRECGLQRVDFFGHAPGVLATHATAIFFKPGSFAFDSRVPLVLPDSGGGGFGHD